MVEGDTLVVTHIDRLSRGLTHGLQVIEGLHRAGVEFRSLSEDFNTATATGKLQLTMVLAFSEWWRNSIRERSVAGQAKARAEGRFPGRRPSLTEQQREYIRVERSKGVSRREFRDGINLWKARRRIRRRTDHLNLWQNSGLNYGTDRDMKMSVNCLLSNIFDSFSLAGSRPVF